MSTSGLLVLVQLVIAAMTTAPCVILLSLPFIGPSACRTAPELPTIVSAGGLHNRWGLFNATTEWLEWVDPTKSTQILERRMVGSLDGAVSDARRQVYDLLTAA